MDNFFGPKKYNHFQLIRDLRAGDDDIAVITLRTIIKLERSNLRTDQDAVEKLKQVVDELGPTWPEEVRFYATRASEHLTALATPVQDDEEQVESLEDAPIELEELDSGDPRVVAHCLKKIEVQEHTPALPKVLEKLERSNDPLMTANLLAALSAIGSSKDLFVVKEFTGNPNNRVRTTVVDAIARLSGEAAVAVPMIEPFLQDRDGSVRARAVRHIGHVDLDRVLPVIEELLHSGEVATRAALAEALTHITDERVAAPLKALSDDAEETVRIKLMEGLSKADHPQKIFIAQKMKKDSSKVVRRVVKEAIQQFETKRLLSMGGFEMPEDGPKQFQSLEEIQDKEELDPIDLDDLRHRELEMQLQCLYKIRQRAYEKGYQAVVDLLGTSENEKLLAHALRCLTVIGSNRDVEAIMHFLGHGSAAVRAAAAEAIAQVSSMTQTIFLLLPMMHDEDPLVRGVAARTMLEYSQEDISRHIQAMSTYEAVPIRGRLMQFLSNYSGQAVAEYLTRATRDSAPQVRHVVASLPLPYEDWAERILAALQRDPDPRIQQAARFAHQARERRRQAGNVPADERPELGQLHEVAREFASAAEDRQAALDEEERQAARADSPDTSRVEAFVRKAAGDLNFKKELEMLELNRDVLLEGMGKKLYQLIKRKQAAHPGYDRTVFLLDKFHHHLKGLGKDSVDTSLWGALTAMAGVQKDQKAEARAREKIRQQFVELGRVAMDLSYKENLLHPELNIEYIECENIEKKIQEKKEED